MTVSGLLLGSETLHVKTTLAYIRWDRGQRSCSNYYIVNPFPAELRWAKTHFMCLCFKYALLKKMCKKFKLMTTNIILSISRATEHFFFKFAHLTTT